MEVRDEGSGIQQTLVISITVSLMKGKWNWRKQPLRIQPIARWYAKVQFFFVMAHIAMILQSKHG